MNILLEPVFWGYLKTAAKADGMTVTAIVANVSAVKHPRQTLASALRCYVLRHALAELEIARGEAALALRRRAA